MNYLAHFHLAGEHPELLLGALLGDYVKGPLNKKVEQSNTHKAWAEKTLHGIKLHRAIDGFSDRHPVQQELATLLPSELRRYRGILFDVFCDHFLTLHWQEFHHKQLHDFNQHVYQVLEHEKNNMPCAAKNQAQRLIDYDALSCFGDLEAVLATIERISLRLREPDKLLAGSEHFADNTARLEDLFLDFYPELVTFSEQYK